MNRRRTFLAGLTLALAVVLTFGLAGAGQAWWSTSVGASGSVGSGTVATSLSGFSDLSTTLTSSTASIVRGVTVTNTGALPLSTATARLAASGTGLDMVAVAVWPLASGMSSCPTTPPDTAATGTWAAPPTWPGISTPMAPGASATFCVRTATTASSAASVTATLTLDAADQHWSTPTRTATATQTVTPTPVSSATVTPAQAGIAPEPGTGTEISGATFTPTSASGTVDPYRFCVDITAGSPDGSPTKWGITIDTTVPPYNALPQSSSWEWGSGVTVTGPDAKGVITVNGTNADYNIKDTLVVHFCVTQSRKSPVLAASSTTYTVGKPLLADCQDRTKPATRYSACVWTDVTGLYPHFYIGFTYSFDLAAVIKASGLDTTLQGYLLKDTVSGLEASFGGLTLASTGTTYTVVSQGIGPTDGSITAGQVDTVKARLSANG